MAGLSRPRRSPGWRLGTWLLCIGWFGFNVMSAQAIAGVSGLVALNSLLAMVGGIIVAALVGRSDPGFVHNGALAGLVAVCAGSDVMHPIGALIVGGVAGLIFVRGFIIVQEKLKIDDVLGVWPLHGLCGLWGGIAAGVFGLEALGGMGGVSPMVQILGSLAISAYALAAGTIVYWLVKRVTTIRLTDEQQRRGADLSIHSIGATPGERRRGRMQGGALLRCRMVSSGLTIASRTPSRDSVRRFQFRVDRRCRHAPCLKTIRRLRPPSPSPFRCG